MFSTLVPVTVSVLMLMLAAGSRAAAVDVKVGDGGLTFAPGEIAAGVGDVVVFHFYSGRGAHSVVASTFEAPCVPASADSFYSGTVQGNSAGDKTFSINITSTDPIWIYCAVGQHCQAGMAAVINAPSNSSESLALYKAAAKGVERSSQPGSAQGGVLATGPTPNSAASAASSTPGSPTSMSTLPVSTAGTSVTSTAASNDTRSSGSSGTPTPATTIADSSTPASASTAAASTTKGSGAGKTSTNGWAVLLALGVVLMGTVGLIV
ncbi:unnamed protein product [Diplocarpon coronariae]